MQLLVGTGVFARCKLIAMFVEMTAAAAAVAWGAADFCGGKASQFADARAVVVISQATSLPLLALCIAVTAPGWPAGASVGWGFAAGLVGAFGLVLLYRALACGSMSTVAPITAVTTAIVPFGVGLVRDSAPSPAVLAGIGCAIFAIGFASLGSRTARPRAASPVHPLGLGLIAGVAFGMFYTLLHQAPRDAGLWPVLGVRLASITAGAALVRVARVPLRLTGRPLRFALWTGACDMAANVLYLAASSSGHLSVVAPIASMYPAITIAFAIWIDRERVRPIQLIGLGLATVALVLVHAGAA